MRKVVYLTVLVAGCAQPQKPSWQGVWTNLGATVSFRQEGRVLKGTFTFLECSSTFETTDFSDRHVTFDAEVRGVKRKWTLTREDNAELRGRAAEQDDEVTWVERK